MSEAVTLQKRRPIEPDAVAAWTMTPSPDGGVRITSSVEATPKRLTDELIQPPCGTLAGSRVGVKSSWIWVAPVARESAWPAVFFAALAFVLAVLAAEVAAPAVALALFAVDFAVSDWLLATFESWTA